MHTIILHLLAAMTLTNAIPSSLKANTRSPVHISDDDSSNGCTSEGFHPNPTDCLKFFRCVTDPRDGSLTRYDFDCAPGTDLWCQSLLTCSFGFQCPEGCSSNSSTSSVAHGVQSGQEVLEGSDDAEAAPRSDHHGGLRK